MNQVGAECTGKHQTEAGHNSGKTLAEAPPCDSAVWSCGSLRLRGARRGASAAPLQLPGGRGPAFLFRRGNRSLVWRGWSSCAGSFALLHQFRLLLHRALISVQNLTFRSPLLYYFRRIRIARKLVQRPSTTRRESPPRLSKVGQLTRLANFSVHQYP